MAIAGGRDSVELLIRFLEGESPLEPLLLLEGESPLEPKMTEILWTEKLNA